MFVLVLPPLGISQRYWAYLFLLFKMKPSLLFYTFPFKGWNALVAASKANLTCRLSWLGSFPACEREVMPHEERLFLLSSLRVNILLSLGFLLFLMPRTSGIKMHPWLFFSCRSEGTQKPSVLWCRLSFSHTGGLTGGEGGGLISRCCTCQGLAHVWGVGNVQQGDGR